MSDIQTVWNVTHGDYVLQGAALARGNDLATAVIISIFTDKTAPDGYQGEVRGWYANPDMGSHIWLLERAKRTQETLQRAQDYIVTALQWMIDQGVVSRFGVYVEWAKANTLAARVVAYKSGGVALALNFTWVWT